MLSSLARLREAAAMADTSFLVEGAAHGAKDTAGDAAALLRFALGGLPSAGRAAVLPELVRCRRHRRRRRAALPPDMSAS
jgi:hypothetical protein